MIITKTRRENKEKKKFLNIFFLSLSLSCNHKTMSQVLKLVLTKKTLDTKSANCLSILQNNNNKKQANEQQKKN